MKDDSKFSEPYGDLSFRIGRGQVDIERRWEALSIINDIMVGLWFISGSALALWGSSQLLLRAILRLGKRIHIRRGYEPSRPRMYRPSRHDAA